MRHTRTHTRSKRMDENHHETNGASRRCSNTINNVSSCPRNNKQKN